MKGAVRQAVEDRLPGGPFFVLQDALLLNAACNMRFFALCKSRNTLDTNALDSYDIDIKSMSQVNKEKMP